MALDTELEDEFEGELEDEMEGELEMEDEAGLEGEGWLGALGNIAGSLLGESEDEYEGEDEYEAEDEFEAEDEISPIRKIYADAMMEHLGELAAEAESEEEAVEHFLPLVGMAASKLLPVVAKAVAPLAKKALPKIAHALTKATPKLTHGIGKVAKTLHRNPQTRHLLRTVPGIARRTVGSIAHKVARGGHVTPRTAVRTLARQTRRVLGTPGHRAQALRRHNHLERRFHGRVGRGMARPHGRYGWRRGRRWGVGGGAAPAYAPGYATGYAAPRAASGVYQPGVSAPPPGVRGGVRAGAPVAGARPVRYGQAVGGQCVCGAAGQTASAPPPAPTPAYCRCCGQVLR
jgi:hypothetical protein